MTIVRFAIVGEKEMCSVKQFILQCPWNAQRTSHDMC